MKIISRIEERKKELLLKKINLGIEKAKSEGRFTLFNAQFAYNAISKSKDYKTLLYYYKLISKMDEEGFISNEDGLMIENEMTNNRVFIHRTNLYLGDDFRNNEDLISIMSNGLRNYGHINASGGGAISNNVPSLGLTATNMEGFAGYKNLLSPYHDNDTVIIMSIPKDKIDSEGNPLGDPNDIYDLSYTPTVKPEYIKGAFVVQNGYKFEFHSKEDILDNKKKNI